ncbi:hypothetical protein BS50DRAFT_557552 [Corynespora cassiicola Philippines]|uniref:Fatty acid desaturase domain-containing protein n=1 Tax=Corynespora cassiicola Philippines TaxID=1448308 RepID=A0A2T2NDR5_CORCC|nr:hypothetical protein BS50DRAFT_557552 [Corynespora cassiicola Philippines]
MSKTETVMSRGDTHEIPDIKVIRDAIPQKCFEPSLSRSMGYVVRDLVAVSIMFYCAATWLVPLQSSWNIPLWALYGFVQGLFFTGIWILAHECGHDAFSMNRKANSIIGFVLHSLVLVPFFSWKFSHSRHHRFANHMDKDTVFVPHRKDHYRASLRKLASFLGSTTEDAPIVTFLQLLSHQLLGWPAYILLNAGAGEKSLIESDRVSAPASKQSHLDPTSFVFRDSEHPFVLISDIGLLAVFSMLYLASQSLGLKAVLLLYGMPYLWMNHWLVAITYLHHTHPEVPHYEHESWTYQKGALSTIDRDFGFIGRHFFHGIIEYHVVHHIFSRIPFYHAQEATEAIAPLLGKAYVRTEGSFMYDLWSTFSTCKYVDERKGTKPGYMYWVTK